MAVDTSIYGNLLAKPPSLTDDINSQQQAQLGATQLAGAKMNLIGQQQSLADQQAVRALYQRPGFDPSTPQGMQDLSAASPTTALATRKAILDNAQTQANTAKLTADAGKAATETQGLTFDQAVKRKNQHLQQLVTVSDVPGAVGWINDAVNSGELPTQQAQQVIQGLQSGQIPLGDWKQKAMMGGLTSQQQLEATKPTYDFKSTGGTLLPIQTNAYAPGGVSTNVPGIAPIPMTASPDAVLSARTSTANTAAGIQKDYKVAGLDANGNFSVPTMPTAPAAPGASVTPGGAPGATPAPAKSMVQSIADSIGKYQTGEAVALQRVPPALKAQVLSDLSDRYPGYNPADFSGIQKTVGSMANGPMGNMVRSINVVQTHMDVMKGLVNAMDNGSVQVINKARNAFETATGQTAPTNLTAAKQLVMGEVANVVAAGASTDGDRKTAQAALDNASSPAQFNQVMDNVIKPLMAGKLQGIEQQYKAGTMGRSDFRSKYLSPAAAASLTALPGGNATDPNAALHSAADAIINGGK